MYGCETSQQEDLIVASSERAKKIIKKKISGVFPQILLVPKYMVF